jgi:hypothetical protein
MTDFESRFLGSNKKSFPSRSQKILHDEPEPRAGVHSFEGCLGRLSYPEEVGAEAGIVYGRVADVIDKRGNPLKISHQQQSSSFVSLCLSL